MPRTINMLEMKRQWDDNPNRCEHQLVEALEQEHLKTSDFSIRDCFEHTIEDGYELLRMMDGRKSGFRHMSERALQEAASAVDTSAFATIAGQFMFSRVKEEYNSDQFIWPDLVETIPTVFINGEIIPGIGGIGDVAEVVEEGQPYPTVGLNEEWIQTVPTQKRGFILPVTREIIIADRTGLLMQRGGRGGFFLGLNKEKRCINVATAAGKAGLPPPNNYKRNGTATNTYLSAGAYINAITGNALSGAGNEWLALQALEILASQLLDPNTGEPIDIDIKAMIVPVSLRRTAERILTATGITTVDMRANASTIRTESGNPYSGGKIKVLSNNWVYQITGSSTQWWAGEPKKAFGYMEVWGVETIEAAKNSVKEFEQDIWQQFKVSERGVAQVIEPRYMFQSGP
jgi:hypothetical protein